MIATTEALRETLASDPVMRQTALHIAGEAQDAGEALRAWVEDLCGLGASGLHVRDDVGRWHICPMPAVMRVLVEDALSRVRWDVVARDFT